MLGKLCNYFDLERKRKCILNWKRKIRIRNPKGRNKNRKIRRIEQDKNKK